MKDKKEWWGNYSRALRGVLSCLEYPPPHFELYLTDEERNSEVYKSIKHLTGEGSFNLAVTRHHANEASLFAKKAASDTEELSQEHLLNHGICERKILEQIDAEAWELYSFLNEVETTQGFGDLFAATITSPLKEEILVISGDVLDLVGRHGAKNVEAKHVKSVEGGPELFEVTDGKKAVLDALAKLSAKPSPGKALIDIIIDKSP